MSLSHHAYSLGASDAKVAFFGELYEKHIKGDLGPFASGLFVGSPLSAAAAGAAGQALDTPAGGSKILRSIGVGAGAAAANKVVSPIANFVAHAVMMGLNPILYSLPVLGYPPVAAAISQLLGTAIHEIPTGIAQSYAATKGRAAAQHLEKFLQKKDVRVP